ncbi:MAG: Transcription termination/antitermination protein NusG [Thermoanaerobacterium thermosaccharolyticum]|jgi:transcription termination/antitermination protein NusG
MTDDGKWYVIYAKAGNEIKVQNLIDSLFKSLNNKLIRTLIPKRAIFERTEKKRVKKIKYLFPGLVFVKTDNISEIYNEIVNTPYHLDIIENEMKPTKVKEDEMQVILSMINESDIIEFSIGIKIGRKVKIVDGPLKDFGGVIEKIDNRKGRAKVRLSISGNVYLVDLGIYVVEDINQLISIKTGELSEQKISSY